MRHYLIASIFALAPFNALASPEEDLRALGDYVLDQMMCDIPSPSIDLAGPRGDTVKAARGLKTKDELRDAIRMETIRLHRELAMEEFDLEHYCEIRGDIREAELYEYNSRNADSDTAPTMAPAQRTAPPAVQPSAPSAAPPVASRNLVDPLEKIVEIRVARKLCRISELYDLTIGAGTLSIAMARGINNIQALELVEYEANRKIRSLRTSGTDINEYCFRVRMDAAGGKFPAPAK